MKKTSLINLETLNEICDGDKSFMLEMINVFIAQALLQVEEIENAVKEKDEDKMKKTAHKYKSSAFIFGIKDLHELLEKLETNGTKGLDEKAVTKYIKKIRNISNTAVEILKEKRTEYI